jgi:hypothetical protein
MANAVFKEPIEKTRRYPKACPKRRRHPVPVVDLPPIMRPTVKA